MSTEPQALATEFYAAITAAWNAADGSAYGAQFAEIADFVDIRGDRHHGAAAIGAGHQAIFDTIYLGSNLHAEVEQARLIAPGVVVAHAATAMHAPTGPLQGVNNARSTVVLVEQGGEWKATAFHNTLAA